MADKFVFTNTYTQATGSVAAGLSNIAIQPIQRSNALLFDKALFGVSVAGSSGAFGINLMGRAPDGTTFVVAGVTALAATKTLFFASTDFNGSTQHVGIPPPYEIQYQRAVGTSISYVSKLWGILYSS